MNPAPARRRGSLTPCGGLVDPELRRATPREIRGVGTRDAGRPARVRSGFLVALLGALSGCAGAEPVPPAEPDPVSGGDVDRANAPDAEHEAASLAEEGPETADPAAAAPEPREVEAPDLEPSDPGSPRLDSTSEQLTPRERDRRGDQHLFAGRFEQAIADFDAFLEAEPELDPHHWRRGIAYYYAGRFAEGAAQFVRHRTVNPDDVENAVWHFLCEARARGVEEARAALLPVGPDPRVPMRAVYELFAGRGSEEAVLRAAASSSQRDARFFAHLYLGLWFDATGDRARAREHLRLAATRHGRSHYMGRIARVHASLLDD